MGLNVLRSLATIKAEPAALLPNNNVALTIHCSIEPGCVLSTSARRFAIVYIFRHGRPFTGGA